MAQGRRQKAEGRGNQTQRHEDTKEIPILGVGVSKKPTPVGRVRY